MRLSLPARAPFRGPTSKSITFTAGGAGLQGAVTDIFDITGEVEIVAMVPFCVTSLGEDVGTPKLKLGIPASTDLFIALTTATLIDSGNFWVWANPSLAGFLLPDALKEVIISEKIVCEVGNTNNIDAGVIRFDVYWLPLSANGALSAA